MESQTQAFNHLLPLDFDNVSTLPDSYAWSTTTLPSDDPCHCTINDRKTSLPIIDIGEPGAYDLLLVARPPSEVIGYGSARIYPFYPKLMWSEGFGMMGSPVEHARKLWPQDHAKFCEVMEQWQAEMKTVCDKIVGIMLGSLGLTHVDDMKWFEPKNGCDQTQCMFHFQLNSYLVCPDPDRAMGLAPHTDTSLIPLLNQCNINGLQVYQDGAGWVPVEPVEGALVVNVDAEVSPLRKLVDSAHPLFYRPVTVKEYVQLKDKVFNKALESIRL
ncbi:hypothetical protein V6N13_106586 [Hibiscus sabdariffa]